MKDVNSESSERQSTLALSAFGDAANVDNSSDTHTSALSKTDSLSPKIADSHPALDFHIADENAMQNQAGHEQLSAAQDPSFIYKSTDEIFTKLNGLYKDLSHFLENIEPYPYLCKKIMEHFDRGMTADDFYHNVFPLYFSRELPDCYTSVICLAYAYCLESKTLLDQGNFQESTERLAEAIRFCKEAEENALIGYDEEEHSPSYNKHSTGTADDGLMVAFKAEPTPEETALNEQKESQYSDRARKGGIAKAETLYRPIKREVIRLLYEKSPEEGWKKIAAAVRAIVDDVYKYQSEITAAENEGLADDDPRRKKEPLSHQNMENTLKKWIREDAEVRAAFEATKQL